MLFLIIVTCILIYASYSYIIAYNFWTKRGVPCKKPWPLFGSTIENIFQRKAFTHVVQDIYNEFRDKRYVGFHGLNIPTFMVQDPELIKKLTVKEFDTFPERRALIEDDVDPLWSKNLFGLRGGERWHNMRATLSPSFTSSKLKTMFELMKECSTKLSAHFLRLGGGGTVEVEMRDTFTKYANDVIATTAFGISCDSLKNPDNEIFVKGKSLTDFSGLRVLKIIFFILLPNLAKILKMKIWGTESGIYFSSVIKDSIKLREEKSIHRPDMINLLLEARKGNLAEDEHTADSGFAVVEESSLVKSHKSKMNITDDDITAQAMIFYFAGFDTSATMMSYASHELAVNPEVQEKLRKEVDEALENCNGKLTYEAIVGMKYLDMVVSETLRKWPPAVMLDRNAVRNFILEPERPDEKTVIIEKGQYVFIPVYSIHHDPQYYPNPDKFDPERFSDENKHKIKPYTYLPFGSGPRNCIGSRFALLEGKLILAEILSKFELVPIEKTQIPLKLSKTNVNPLPDEGFWMGMKPRDN